MAGDDFKRLAGTMTNITYENPPPRLLRQLRRLPVAGIG